MKQFILILMVASVWVTRADVSVKSVEAHQRYPWNGLVDISVTLECSADDIAKVECSFVATNSATRAAVPVTSIVQKGVDAGSGAAWTRQFVWDATNDLGSVKIDDLVFVADAEVNALGGVQLWEDGPYWAKCNVGATKPEECGYYFWWGDTIGYKRNASNDGWISVKDGAVFSFPLGDCPTHGKDNSALQSAGYIDSTGNLVAGYDAATAHLGAPWRMPTEAEFSSLTINCNTTWTTRNGVYGRLVTGRGAYASKSIFLPAAGNGWLCFFSGAGSLGAYWSSTPNPNYWNGSFFVNFNSIAFGGVNCCSGRNDGYPVRPLRGFAK